MLELCRKKLDILTGLRTWHCHIEKHIATLGLKQNSDCRYCGAEDGNQEYLALNCIAQKSLPTI